MVKTSPAPKSTPQLLRPWGTNGQARAFLRYFKLLSTRHIYQYSMFVLRRIWRLMALLLGRGEPVAAATDREILGPVEMIRLRVIRPDGSFATRPGFLWCHGGGFSLAVNSMLDAYGVTSALASTQEGV